MYLRRFLEMAVVLQSRHRVLWTILLDQLLFMATKMWLLRWIMMILYTWECLEFIYSCRTLSKLYLLYIIVPGDEEWLHSNCYSLPIIRYRSYLVNSIFWLVLLYNVKCNLRYNLLWNGQQYLVWNLHIIVLFIVEIRFYTVIFAILV